MSTFYIDLDNGSDAADGSSWANAWKTITSGATAARIAPGDTIRISKTPDPVSIGNGTWTDCPSGGFNPTTVNISSSTNASPIEITTSANHNLSTGDVVLVYGHATNYTANGNWQITYVSATKFTLDNSTGVGTGGASGSIRKINSKAVVLATAQTQNVVTTEGGWTGTGDISLGYASSATKSGYNEISLTIDGSPTTNTLQAYKGITSIDLSGNQKISFFVINYTIAVSANQWYIALCSDSSGATPVDIFRIPAITSNTRKVPLTIERDYSVAFTGGTGTAPTPGTTITGGTSTQTAVVITSTLSSGTWAGNDAAGVIFVHTRSGAFQTEQVNFGGGSDHFDIAGDFARGNLGSAIQSVAIYSGNTSPIASVVIRFEHFIACTTNGLALDSLISKNGSAQGGTEGYYGIQSINGKVVVLDNDTNTVSTAGRGYSGTSETVTTYIRQTYKTAMAASSTTQVSVLNDSGTLGNLIAYEFGYEVGTTNQNGETFLDGLNGNGYGIYATSKSFNSLNWCSCVRYNYGIGFISTNSNNFIHNSSSISNNTTGGIILNASNNCSINVTTTNNNSSYGIGCSSNSLNNTININSCCNNINYGIFLNAGSGVYNDITFSKSSNNYYGIYLNSSSNNTFKNGLLTNNLTSSVYSDSNNKIRNLLLSDSTEFTGQLFSQAVIWSYDHDQTDGNHWGFFYGGTFNWQTDTKHSSEAGAWKTAITSSDRASNYKAVLPVAEVAGIASTNLTVTAWVKKDHATNVACRLVCYADDALGISEVSDTKADDTDWEQLSITLNSAHANPVFKIYLETWYVSETSNTYVGTITVS